jgi:hypothetical protein
MLSAPTETATHGAQPMLIGAEAARALTERRLAELGRLRDMCLERVESLGVLNDDLRQSPEQRVKALTGSNGIVASFVHVTRSFRQIVVLEFELLGLFNAPDRDATRKPRLPKVRLDGLADLKLLHLDNLKDLENAKTPLDYRIGPLDQVVAGIRKTLGAEAPEDDPFAPPAERGVPEPAAPQARATSPRKPAMQVRLTVKAAVPALPRKGFRLAPTSPHNPNTPSAARKGPHNRGPPK